METIIRFNNTGEMYIIDAGEITEMNVCDTYDDYGQTVDHYYAGDYCPENSSCDFCGDLVKKLEKEGFGSKIAEIREENNYSYNEIGEILLGTGYDTEIQIPEMMQNLIREFAENEPVYNKCEGFNYWDGSNWKTITTYMEFGNADAEILEDEEVSEILEQWDNSETGDWENGTRTSVSEDYEFTESQWAGTFGILVETK